ncbi:pre-mRNA splicing regulator USH1G-like [Macrosteles quadrilineatus]|uniref:pre-mRNA splicing regulator USH1G-like n=1 Tax=Macrosteles quadrilineatus TaxID=74068 RepID=UPI0023E22B2D|nr:pre-mRNA splicing regulator USH1G-like [Macrosteles quadrilineatus]
MTTTRFHKAAQDGMLDILREATKRDCNLKDEDGMTPTLWAAFHGHLDVLRLLVGRGGDPEKCNYHFGQNALHLSASKGHLACVTFLVGFDVNLWALDLDLHTALQVAGLNGRRDVVEFLDKTMAKQELHNKKEVKVKKEKAMKDVEKNRKKFNERMKKEQDKEEKRLKKVEKEILGGAKVEMDMPIPTVIVRKPVNAEVGGPTFTQIVGGTINKKPTGAVGVKKILDRKLKNGTHNHRPFQTEIKGDSDSGRSVRARPDSQIIYVNSYDTQNGGKRGRIADVFDTRGELVRSLSQPEYLNTVITHEQASIFDRPGFGSVAFRPRNHLAGTMSGGGGEKEGGENSSIGSAGSLAKRNQGELCWESDEENSGIVGSIASLQRFLLSAGVADYTDQFVDQRIDLEAMLMLSDQDLITLGIPMGPRRKILHAIEERRRALSTPGGIQDSWL